MIFFKGGKMSLEWFLEAAFLAVGPTIALIPA